MQNTSLLSTPPLVKRRPAQLASSSGFSVRNHAQEFKHYANDTTET
jgi:hypothetical protein